MNSRNIPDALIYDSIRLLPRELPKAGCMREYEAFYLAAPVLSRHGIEVLPRDRRRPILLLAGTSIPICDRIDLVQDLFESGYEVATISNQIGGLFNVSINPKKDRVDSLRHYLQHLIDHEKVDAVDIVAQSYSAFEVIRLLSENPAKYQSVVKSVILVNPPGFSKDTGVIKHCSRFVWHHVLKGYSSAVKSLLSRNSEAGDKKFVKREVTGISTWVYKTLKNPTRTMKEVFDIVSYVIKDTLVLLQQKYHYDVNIFLQAGDQILPLTTTLSQVEDILPDRNIKVVPGGHNDVFFQKWQRNALFEFIKEIRLRQNVSTDGEFPAAD